MRRPVALLICVLALGCGTEEPTPAPAPVPTEQGEDPTPRAATDPTPEPSEAVPDPETWPPEELLERAARLGDPQQREEALAELEALPLAEQVELLRAGLRLPDGPAALECARRMEKEWLDDCELSRVALLLAGAVAAGDRTDGSNSYWDVLEFVSGDDLKQILAAFPPDDPAVLPNTSANVMHKVARADHLPRLAELYAEHPDTASAINELVWLVVRNTDQHREDVARIALGADVAAALPADDGEGLPPLLVACLADALACDQLYDVYGHWARRWLRDATPGERDVPLLLKLGLEDAGDAIWNLRLVPGPAAEAALRELLEDDPKDSEFRIRGALALRGDEKALADIVAATPADEHALAVLLGIDPQLAVDRVAGVLLDPALDDEAFAEALDAVRGAAGSVRYVDGIDWDPAAFDGFERRVIASPLGPYRILDLAWYVPRCWTRVMADTCLQRLSDRPPSELIENGDPSELAFLEIAAPDELRARLRTWAALPEGPASEFALEVLAMLGDPLAGDLLAAWLRRRLETERPSAWDLMYFGRSPSPALRKLLHGIVSGDLDTGSDQAVDGAMRALAMLDGVPWGALDLLDHQEVLRPELLELVVAGKSVEAVLLLLYAYPGVECREVGDIDDPRIAPRLRKIRDRRELGMYVWATAELAVAGDEQARAEILRGASGTRYRWGDILDWRTMTLGSAAETIPLWLDGLESSCCWHPIAAGNLHDLIGEEPRSNEGWRTTSREQIERWLADHPGPYVRSRLAEHALPAVR